MSKINDSNNVVIILDSDDEQEFSTSHIKQRYTTIIIDSDGEEEMKNQKVEDIIMDKVEKQRPSSLPTNINKLFQKDTRLSNLKKATKTRKEPQQQKQTLDDSIAMTMSQLVEEHCDFDKHFRDLNASKIDKELEEIFSTDTDADFSTARGSSSSIIKDFESDPMSIIDSQQDIPIPKNTTTKARKTATTPTKPAVRTPNKREENREQDSAEEDLEYYVSFFNKKRKRSSVPHTVSQHVFDFYVVYAKKHIFQAPARTTNIQCPICYLLFPKTELVEHAADCNGEKASDKGIVRKSISAAILLEQKERERQIGQSVKQYVWFMLILCV